MSCRNSWDPCNNTVCTCAPAPCPPTPCTTGCLIDVPAPCVYLNEDLTVCTDTYVKGTKLDRVLQDFATKLCGEIVVTTLDIHSRVSSTDTTSDYLKNKLTGSNAIKVAQTNIGSNEELIFSIILSEASNNCLQVLNDGLYMACPPSSNGSPTTLSAVLTPSIEMIVLPVTGGYTVKGNVKIDTTPGNALIPGVNGLYVAPPISQSQVTLTPVGTATVNMIISQIGSNYNVSAQIKMDPASTLPYTIGPNGLKLDCCATGNTLLTRTNTQSIHHTITPITGGYNIESEVQRDPSGTNILQILPGGLYVPNTGSTITPDDTDSIALTMLPGNHLKADLNIQGSDSVSLTVNSSGLKADVLIDTVTPGNVAQITTGMNGGIFVPSSIIAYSTDTCNAAMAGTDGNLFVQAALLPYGLVIYKDGADITARFNGPSPTNTDYEVWVQGTTGSALVWVNVDSGYDSVFTISGISTLFYHVAITSAIESSCMLLSVKVRQKCTNGNGEWLSVVYDPSKDLSFTSSDSSVAINTSNCGIIDLTMPTITCSTPSPGDVALAIMVSNTESYLQVTWNAINDGTEIIIEIPYTDIEGNSKKIQERISTVNGFAASNIIPLPKFNTSQTQSLIIKVGRNCPGATTYITETVVYTASACEGWVDVPVGLMNNGWLRDHLQYRVRDNAIEFRGNVYKNFSTGPSLGTAAATVYQSRAHLTVWDTIFDAASLDICTHPAVPTGFVNYGLKDFYQGRKGTTGYESNDSMNVTLYRVGTEMKPELFYESYMDDGSLTHTGLIFSSAITTRYITVSFEGVKIYLT